MIDSSAIKFKKLLPTAIVPTMASIGANCWDVFAAEDVEFLPGEIKLVRTGLAIEPPPGLRFNMYIRSSTSLKRGFSLANGVAIIDDCYRGDFTIQLMNIKNEWDVMTNTLKWQRNKVSQGDKIAQIELVNAVDPLVWHFEEVDVLFNTERGEKGFGSSDKV